MVVTALHRGLVDHQPSPTWPPCRFYKIGTLVLALPLALLLILILLQFRWRDQGLQNKCLSLKSISSSSISASALRSSNLLLATLLKVISVTTPRHPATP